MARVPQITRTVTTTETVIMCLDIDKQETVTKTITLPRTFKTDAQLLKAVKKAVDTDTFKAVHVISATVKTTLYGMSEQKFIECADELPPRKNYNI